MILGTRNSGNRGGARWRLQQLGTEVVESLHLGGTERGAIWIGGVGILGSRDVPLAAVHYSSVSVV